MKFDNNQSTAAMKPEEVSATPPERIWIDLPVEKKTFFYFDANQHAPSQEYIRADLGASQPGSVGAVDGLETALYVVASHREHGEFEHGGRDECVEKICEELRARIATPATTTDDFEDKIDNELRRWQDGIRDRLISLGVPDSIIDGAGCDSGDPLDFTLAEIDQGVGWFIDQLPATTTVERSEPPPVKQLAREAAVMICGMLDVRQTQWLRVTAIIESVFTRPAFNRAELLADMKHSQAAIDAAAKEIWERFRVHDAGNNINEIQVATFAKIIKKHLEQPYSESSTTEAGEETK